MRKYAGESHRLVNAKLMLWRIGMRTTKLIKLQMYFANPQFSKSSPTKNVKNNTFPPSWRVNPPPLFFYPQNTQKAKQKG
jgi:hypothetical protein